MMLLYGESISSYKDLSFPDRCNFIRDFYYKNVEAKLKAANYRGMRISPYWINWQFTPIEFNVWCDIRNIGIPFYPQIPVLNYFIDFADPCKKIGIEVDGKEFHHDKGKDQKRDLKLQKEGWKIIRIPGSLSFKDECVDIISDLKKSHYTNRPLYTEDEDWEEDYNND